MHQKNGILNLKMRYTPNMRSGITQINAIPVIPILWNSYRAIKNRRKSIATLPPFSREYVDIRFVIYLAWLFSTAVRPICEIRYTKLLNLVYGGNWPTNSSTA